VKQRIIVLILCSLAFCSYSQNGLRIPVIGLEFDLSLGNAFPVGSFSAGEGKPNDIFKYAKSSASSFAFNFETILRRNGKAYILGLSNYTFASNIERYKASVQKNYPLSETDAFFSSHYNLTVIDLGMSSPMEKDRFSFEPGIRLGLGILDPPLTEIYLKDKQNGMYKTIIYPQYFQLLTTIIPFLKVGYNFPKSDLSSGVFLKIEYIFSHFEAILEQKILNQNLSTVSYDYPYEKSYLAAVTLTLGFYLNFTLYKSIYDKKGI